MAFIYRVGVTYRVENRLRPYEDALRIVGLEPVRIQVKDMIGCRLTFDGLLLPGGPDIDPAQYNCSLDPATKNIDTERDLGETAVAKMALSRGIPILAICRGMQLLNVISGGTLVQDVSSHLCHMMKTSPLDFPGQHAAAHSVTVTSGTRLSSVVKCASIEVNSRHHQAVRKLGTGLLISAVAPDGTIEAIERGEGTFVLGVQWHPEDRILATEHDKAIFTAFAEEISRACPTP